MDLKKIGEFLKELRREKELSQEALAEIFRVSRRTVSRWETGRNLPDITVLLEIADFYDLDLREILNGERKGKVMDKDVKETVLKAAEYSNEGKNILTKRIRWLFVLSLIFSVVRIVIGRLGLVGNVFDFIEGACDGFVVVTLVVGIIGASRYGTQFIEGKQRLKQKRLKH
jgi:transcriptional regulator with XRE-family HTH domain